MQACRNDATNGGQVIGLGSLNLAVASSSAPIGRSSNGLPPGYRCKFAWTSLAVAAHMWETALRARPTAGAVP